MEEEQVRLTTWEEEKPPFSLKKKIWLNVLLFVITACSIFYVGINLSFNYKNAEILVQNSEFLPDLSAIFSSEVIGLSILYTAVLLGILLSHELGHFLACRYYRINATLPYFIPFPNLIGTMGAFIKIKSPIKKKHQLFDIGIAGPLAGFIFSLPALVYGLSQSKVVPSIAAKGGSIMLGEPLLLKIIEGMSFKHIPPNSDIFLHPVAFAGWVGLLVTALNLFPMGQLDGGHISYAILGSRSRKLARVFLALFFVLGVFLWVGWFLWAFLIILLGTKHPAIEDEAEPLSQGRKIVAYVIILIFILSFIPDPIKGFNLLDLLELWLFK
jgi:hypothetical protein